jgi:hypothetical protein
MIKRQFPGKQVIAYVPARHPHRGAAAHLRAAADKDRTLPLSPLKHSQFPPIVQYGFATLGQTLRLHPIGQNAVVPNAHEAPRHDVLEEPADELVGRQSGRLATVPVAAVAPGEAGLIRKPLPSAVLYRAAWEPESGCGWARSA